MSVESIRLIIFILVFLLCACWEWQKPRRPLTDTKLSRWINNLTLVSLNSLLLVLLAPAIAINTAIYSQQSSIGLLHHLNWGVWPEILLTIFCLDLVIYLQHLLFHRVPFLWRLHRMHHADLDIDVTTGTRFHPLEILISMVIKVAAILLLGAPIVAVILFEVLLNASAMFNHSNGKLPSWLDKQLRKLVVTPDMHRVHHSVLKAETHSNFGFFLSIWDKAFKTYIPQPKEGHNNMTIGLDEFRDPKEKRLDYLLTQPFRDSKD